MRSWCRSARTTAPEALDEVYLMMRASTQSAWSRTSPRSPNSVMRMSDFAWEMSMSTARGRSRAVNGRRGQPGYLVNQHSKDHAPQRACPVVDADERLKAAIAGFQAVSQQGAALSSQAAVVDAAAQLKSMIVDRSVPPGFPGRAEIRLVTLRVDGSLGEILDRGRARVQANQIADREPDGLGQTSSSR